MGHSDRGSDDAPAGYLPEALKKMLGRVSARVGRGRGRG